MIVLFDTRRFATLIVLALVPTLGVAQTYETNSGNVQFTSRVPLHDFTGTSSSLNGLINLADSTLDFYVDLETLDTGNGKRDRDMRRTLDTARHPFAEFTGRLSGPFDPELPEAQPVVATGQFTISGVRRDLQVTGTLEPIDGSDGALRLTASWTLSLSDYDIKPPRLLIVKVADEQLVEVNAMLARGGLND